MPRRKVPSGLRRSLSRTCPECRASKKKGGSLSGSAFKTSSLHVICRTNIYCNLNENGYDRQIVNHSQKEFAVDKKSTNTIEGFWGQFKRMVYGTYHFVSRHYMQRYIDEAVFRYNNRKLNGGERFAILMEHALNVVTFDKVKVVRCVA